MQSQWTQPSAPSFFARTLIDDRNRTTRPPSSSLLSTRFFLRKISCKSRCASPAAEGEPLAVQATNSEQKQEQNQEMYFGPLSPHPRLNTRRGHVLLRKIGISLCFVRRRNVQGVVEEDTTERVVVARQTTGQVQDHQHPGCSTHHHTLRNICISLRLIPRGTLRRSDQATAQALDVGQPATLEEVQKSTQVDEPDFKLQMPGDLL